MKMGFYVVPFDAFMIKYSLRILWTAAPPLQRQNQLSLFSHESASVHAGKGEWQSPASWINGQAERKT